MRDIDGACCCLRSLVAGNTPPAVFFHLTYSPTSSRCLVVLVTSRLRYHLPTVCRQHVVSLTRGATVSGIPDLTYPQVHKAVVSRLTRSTLRDPLRPGTPMRAPRMEIYCATQKLRVGPTRPQLTSALKKPDPGPVKTSSLFLAKITLSKPLPRQQFLAFGNTQPLRTSTVKTLMILPRLCSTPWRHAHASHLPTCTRRRVYRGHRARSLATVLLFSSPSIGYQKPLPQHGLSSCPYLGTRVGPVLWGTASN